MVFRDRFVSPVYIDQSISRKCTSVAHLCKITCTSMINSTDTRLTGISPQILTFMVQFHQIRQKKLLVYNNVTMTVTDNDL